MTSTIHSFNPHSNGYKGNFAYDQTVEEIDEIEEFEQIDDTTEDDEFLGKSVSYPLRTTVNTQFMSGTLLANSDGSLTRFAATLCNAAWLSNFEAISAAKPTEVNHIDSRSYTALHYACANGNDDIVNALLERGSHANVADKRGITPLIFAALEGNLPVVTALIEHGADPNISTPFGETALHLAVRYI